jgi:hypothetical protein
MPPKPKPQPKAEDSTSDHDDAHEERITALENNVQSINSKLDQILTSLAAQQQQIQRLHTSEVTKPIPLRSSNVSSDATVKDIKPIPLKSSNVPFEATVKDIGLFDPIEDKEAVWTENIYTEIAAHLLDLKTSKLTEIRVHFMQRQLLVSNLCQSLYATSTSPSPHQKAVEAPPTQWRNQRNTRRTLYMEQPDPGGGSDVNGANISL